jgi:phage tail-like protein
MPVANRKDPFRAFNFLVEIDGITRAGFQECSGLDVTLDPVEYREGGEPITPRKLPGLAKYANITLKRGITDDQELWEWIQQGVQGETERKNGSIILLDAHGEEQSRWNFRDGWPTKWTGPSFNATDNSVAVETLEIAHEGVAVA